MVTVSIPITYYARATLVSLERSSTGEPYVSISYDGLQIVLSISEAQHLLEVLQSTLQLKEARP